MGRCRWQTVEDEWPRTRRDRWVRYEASGPVEAVEVIPVRDQRTYGIKADWLMVRGIREVDWVGEILVSIRPYQSPEHDAS